MQNVEEDKIFDNAINLLKNKKFVKASKLFNHINSAEAIAYRALCYILDDDIGRKGGKFSEIIKISAKKHNIQLDQIMPILRKIVKEYEKDINPILYKKVNIIIYDDKLRNAKRILADKILDIHIQVNQNIEKITGKSYDKYCGNSLYIAKKLVGEKFNKYYNSLTINEILEATKMVEYKEFVDKLTDFYISEMNKPEKQRGHQILYKHNDKTIALCNELESMGIDVIELVHQYRDIYCFKICTPINCYLDCGTRDDIINMAQKDIDVYNHAVCLSCEQKIDYRNRNYSGIITCNCGSILGHIPENFAKFATKLIIDKYGLDGVYTILLNWDDLYYHDDEIEYDWLFVDKIENYL